MNRVVECVGGALKCVHLNSIFFLVPRGLQNFNNCQQKYLMATQFQVCFVATLISVSAITVYIWLVVEATQQNKSTPVLSFDLFKIPSANATVTNITIEKVPVDVKTRLTERTQQIKQVCREKGFSQNVDPVREDSELSSIFYNTNLNILVCLY